MFVTQCKCSWKQRVTIVFRNGQVALCSRHNFTRSRLLVLDPVRGKETWCLFTRFFWVLWAEVSSSRLANQLIRDHDRKPIPGLILSISRIFVTLEICAKHLISGTSEINGQDIFIGPMRYIQWQELIFERIVKDGLLFS